MPKGKATIDWDGYELVVKYDPYRPDIVHEIKSGIPQAYRSWDPVDKVWRVSTLYKQIVEDIFDVFEYAVRDFTGDDQASRLRQAGLRAERDAQINSEEEKRKAREKKKQAHEEEQEERRRTAEQARAEKGEYDPMSGSRTYTGAERNTDSAAAKKAKWHTRFFEVWPEATETEFHYWYTLYLIYGREWANAQYNQLKGRTRQGQDYQGPFGRNRRFEGNRQNGTQTIDPYTVLGIIRSSNLEEAKVAYRKLAMQWHPDRNPGNPEALKKMQEINAAWDVIKKEQGW